MKQLFDADQRLVMLRTLTDIAGWSCNDSILNDVLGTYGHRISRDKVRAHIEFLGDKDLLTFSIIGSTYVVTLTQRGADVACGRVIVDGVKRPAPGE